MKTHRPVHRRSAIAAACLVLTHAATLAAEDATQVAAAEPTDAAPRVVVTSRKLQSLPVAAPTPTTVESVSGAQIEETINTVTSAGALQYLPSTHVRERYIGDRNGVLVMRVNSSIASAQTTVYADGLLLSNFLNNSFSTAPRWGMVSPEEIERIDVSYGPYSALYPGNSAGGVVRMTTRMPTKFEAHAKLDVFNERFKEYGTNAEFGGAHASLSLGNAAGAWSYWVSLDHLDNKSHPQTFGNTVAKSGAAAAAGSYTDVSGSVVYNDVDTSGNARTIVSSTGIDHTVQDMAKLKLAYRFSPAWQASYTLGLWQNVSDGSVDSYLRDAAGNTVYNAGASYANPFKFVRINGKDYTVSAAVPSRSESEHWMHGLALASNTGGVWDVDLVASLYDQKKDVSRTAAPTNGTDNGLGATRPAGQVTYADGTGWHNADLRGTWRGLPGHTLNAGLHHDRYELVNNTYSDKAVVTDWFTANPDRSKNANAGSYGVTQTDAVYLQDEWAFAPAWTVMAGLRQEQWQASGGMNRTTTTGATPTTTDLVYAPRSYSHLSPKLHLAWQLQPDLALKASWGHAVRYPTVSEMFQTYTDLNNVKVNDPNLKPEQVNALELVALKQWPSGMLRASYFREDKSDALISQRIAGASSTVTTSTIQNVGQVQTEGLELAFGERDLLVGGLELNGSLTYTHSLITRDDAWPLLVGTAQPRIPDWRATLVATYRASEALSYSLSYRYSGRQHNALASTTTGQFADVNPDVYGAVSHYSVFDAKVLYRINRHWTGSVGVNNLGNFKYYVNPNPYPQRTLFASVKYDL